MQIGIHVFVFDSRGLPARGVGLGLVVGTDGSAGSTEVLRLSPRELGAGETTLVLVVGLLGALVASHGLFKGMALGCGPILAAGGPHPALAGWFGAPMPALLYEVLASSGGVWG